MKRIDNFTQNINTRKNTQVVANTGTITVGDLSAELRTGADPGSQAILYNNYPVPIKEGGVITFEAKFAAPSVGDPDNNIVLGLSNVINSVAIGYQGTTWSTLSRVDGTSVWNAIGNEFSHEAFDPTLWNSFRIEISTDRAEFYRRAKRVYQKFAQIEGNLYSVDWLSLSASCESVGTGDDFGVNVRRWSVEMKNGEMGNPYTVSNSKTGVTTLVPILSLRTNEDWISGTNNQKAPLLIHSLAIANEGTKTGRVVIIQNPTTLADPGFDQEGDISELDTSATAITGGIEIFSIPFGRDSAYTVELSDLPPLGVQNVYSFCAEASATTEVRIDVNFCEPI